MNQELCFGQRYDQELGILEPWYTNPSMDVIKTWDLKDKIVMEWGGGSSTLWWLTKGSKVHMIDHNAEWAVFVSGQARDRGFGNDLGITIVQTHEGDQSEMRDEYVKAFPNINPDICIVDGIHRYECAEYAIKHFRPKILIVDNHQQDYVFLCPALDELTKNLKMERFIQPDHTDHSGRPWATAIFYL